MSKSPPNAKQVWKDLRELTAPAPRDEFAPEVAKILARLRTAHGQTNASCQEAGNTPEQLDAIRAELSTALPGVNRRGFLQLTGAAAVFAMAGCWHKDPDTLVPYAQQPEGTTIGKPVWWSTVLRDSGRPVGVLAKTYDGKPIKLEGNPDHPQSRGRLDTRSQAALLNLYDPDRQQQGPLNRAGGNATAIGWDALDAEVGAALKSGGIGLITGPVDGPASRKLIDELKAAFGNRLRHAAYDPYASDVAVKARKLCFGDAEAKPPVYHLERAAVLLTLGSDILGGGQTGLTEQIGFGDLRRLRAPGAKAEMGQVIAFEPTLSQTGTVSDVRVRAPMTKMNAVAWAIADAVDQLIKGVKPDAVKVDELGLRRVPRDGKEMAAVLYAALALVEAKQAGKTSLVYVGGATHGGDNSLPLHIAANYLNARLGNEGVTVETASQPASAIHASVAETESILAACRDGGIQTLIVRDANPAYSLPAARDALAKVKTLVVLGDRADETFAAGGGATYLAPALHGLESWGDAETSAGVVSVQQPVIQPLWDTRAAEESLMAFAVAAGVAPKSFIQDADPKVQPAPAVCGRQGLWTAALKGVQSWRGYVHAIWIAAVKPASKAIADDRTFWNAALAQGVVVLPAPKPGAPAAFRAETAGPARAATIPAPAAGKLSLVLSASRHLRDGAWANNAWLQEAPDPVSKITWDNYLAVSVGDAAKLGIAPQAYETIPDNPVVKLTVGGKSVAVPVHLQEGQDPGTIELFLGWGRGEHAGAVARGAGPDGVGANAFELEGPGHQRWGLDATIEATGETYTLACTQGHNTMDGRESLLAADDVLALHRADADHEKRREGSALWSKGNDGKPDGRLSLWQQEHVYPGRRWGMVIDLGTCIGCNACLIACNAENNVPVVGRTEVRRGREMHWIRIDRYYSGRSDDVDRLDIEVVQQPMVCQQCGHAPCEEVCPAMATMHNDEGLNVQIYNRCIGTRYCSNNCPYKVRRFNFYEYSKYRIGPQGTSSPFTRIAKNLVTEGATSSGAELSVAPLEMVLNPIVAVRSKGVMEKCSFCYQRTRDIREQEKLTNRQYQDGSITTACAQTCPTGAIVFGDINDDDARVTQLGKQSPHAYHVLDEELNTRPSVAYLRRIRNRGLTDEERKSLAKIEGHGAEKGDG